MPVELIGKKLTDARGGAGDPDCLALVIGFGEFTANDFVYGVGEEEADEQVKDHLVW